MYARCRRGPEGASRPAAQAAAVTDPEVGLMLHPLVTDVNLCELLGPDVTHLDLRDLPCE